MAGFAGYEGTRASWFAKYEEMFEPYESTRALELIHCVERITNIDGKRISVLEDRVRWLKYAFSVLAGLFVGSIVPFMVLHLLVGH